MLFKIWIKWKKMYTCPVILEKNTSTTKISPSAESDYGFLFDQMANSFIENKHIINVTSWHISILH